MQLNNDKFEDVLNRFGELVYTNKGTSMLPMLREKKDVFTIARKTDQRCKENDVILFKRDGKYILHRVVKVYDDHYTTIGDNCITYEKDVKDDDVLGVLVSFQRNGRIYKMNDLSYRLYVFFLRLLERPRIIIKKLKLFLRNVLRKQN